MPPTEPRYLEGGSEAQIPDMVGERVDSARAQLEQGGFTVTTREVDNRAPKGTVIAIVGIRETRVTNHDWSLSSRHWKGRWKSSRRCRRRNAGR